MGREEDANRKRDEEAENKRRRAREREAENKRRRTRGEAENKRRTAREEEAENIGRTAREEEVENKRRTAREEEAENKRRRAREEEETEQVDKFTTSGIGSTNQVQSTTLTQKKKQDKKVAKNDQNGDGLHTNHLVSLWCRPARA